MNVREGTKLTNFKRKAEEAGVGATLPGTKALGEATVPLPSPPPTRPACCRREPYLCPPLTWLTLFICSGDFLRPCPIQFEFQPKPLSAPTP